jgi:type I restriction enzyme, S subunit
MNLNLHPYPAYKDAGLSWLKEMPEHWEVRRNGRLFAQRKETGFTDLPILEVSLRTGVSVRKFDAGGRKQVMSDRSKYKRAAKGDIAYNMMRMWQGAVGVVPEDGLVSPAYVVASPFENVDPDYFSKLFRTDAYMGEVDAHSHGIVKDRNRLYWEDFKQIFSAYPPLEEQKKITRFISHMDRGIRRYIFAKRKLIGLLAQQKQAIFHHAVTRGLDPHVHFGPSGIGWIGDVPRHWEVSRVKNEFDCLNRYRVPLSSTERGAMTLRAYDYYGASGIIDKVDNFIFNDELLLIAEDGANLVLRNLPLAIIARGKFWVNNHAHILKPKRGNLEYLTAVMEQINYTPWISGAAQPKLTQDRLMSIAIAVPPREEQDKIIASAQAETAPLRAAIDRTKSEIALIGEFRTRLIADVVTGKLDVRAAANLPDDADGVDELSMADDALFETEDDTELTSEEPTEEE